MKKSFLKIGLSLMLSTIPLSAFANGVGVVDTKKNI